MEGKVIKLKKPIVGADADAPPIEQVILKEPSGADYLRIGDPFTVKRSADGGLDVVSNMDAMRAYVPIVTGLLPPLVARLSAHDAVAITREISAFFADAQDEKT